MNELELTFVKLRSVMLAHAKGLDRVTDTDSHLYLNTRFIQSNKKPLFFGAVQKKAKGVSFHLMPLYTHPTLLRSVTSALKKKMQGKSCFTLDAAEPTLIKDLSALTKASVEEYKKAGYV